MEQPRIIPMRAPDARVAPAGLSSQMHIVADVDVREYPDGLTISSQRPGSLELEGSGHLPAGCMLLLVPPEMADQMRKAGLVTHNGKPA